VRVYQFRHTGLRTVILYRWLFISAKENRQGKTGLQRSAAREAPHLRQVLAPVCGARFSHPPLAFTEGIGQVLSAATNPIDVTMKHSWIERLSRDPAAAAAFIVFVAGAGTILTVWYFEFVLHYQPCPLCFEERIPYYIVIPLSLVVAIAALLRVPRALITAGLLVIAAAMLCSVALGAYHAGIEWRFWPGPPDCTGAMTDFTKKGSLLDQLQSIRIVLCDEAAWRLLGISLAGYNALVSLVLAAIAIFGAHARRPV
jgi:disulfide bond formation protein DsbB